MKKIYLFILLAIALAFSLFLFFNCNERFQEATLEEIDTAPVADHRIAKEAAAGDRGSSKKEGSDGSAKESKARKKSTSQAAAEDPGQKAPEANLLTAGMWDDNRDFDLYLKYFEKIGHSKKGTQVTGLPSYEIAELKKANKRFADSRYEKKHIDVALVIDTTGSMGDELEYLKTELLAITRKIHDKYPQAKQRWALIVYRDQGDQYVTRVFDFQWKFESFLSKLKQQHANGGGDFPEAVDKALARINKLSWRNAGNVARLAFWLADAPHHKQQSNYVRKEVLKASARDVHIYPVASSGIDSLTEFTMRSAAQLTGGRYLFLTDDSGVGNPHAEPTIPCYFVTKLDEAMRRAVDMEMSGTYQLPNKRDILRVGGNLQHKSCQIDQRER